MRRATLVLLGLALCVPVALGANGEPQKKLTKAGQARARMVSVRASDVGSGWKATVSKDRNQSSPRCSTYNPDQSDLVEVGSYDSPDFSRPDSTFVSSTTGVFRTAAMARKGYARVAVPEIAGCFAELLAKQFKKPETLTVTDKGTLKFPHYGDRSNAYGVRTLYTSGKAKVPFAIDFVLFNKGAVDVAIIFFGVGRPLPAAFEQHVVSRVAARA